METAESIIERAKKSNPGTVYRAAINGDSIAAWSQGRWIPVAMKTIMGTWASMPYELLVNGKPVCPQEYYEAKP